MALSASEKRWFTQILGLPGQAVEDGYLDEEKGEFHLTLAGPMAPFVCPHCGKQHAKAHDRREKVLRDKPWADHEVFVHLPVVRIRCCKGLMPIELPLPSFVKKNSGTAGGSV
jgi:transposase